MIKKILFVAVVLALLFGSLSCGLTKPSISGTYVCTQGGKQIGGFVKGDILQLSKDGTVFAYTPGQPGIAGKWKVNGDEITITFEEFFGMTYKGKIEGDTITFHDGSVLIKKGATDSATPTSPPGEVTTPTSPTAAIPLPSGTTSVGDFTVALSSVEREESLTTLHFAITKASNKVDGL